MSTTTTKRNTGHLSPNARYERKMKDAGFNKITIWVTDAAEDHFKEMADFCKTNRDCYPAQLKSFKTGRMVRMK